MAFHVISKLHVVVVIITLPLRRLNANTSGRRINIIMLTNYSSFWPCCVSLYLSLPIQLIGLLDPSSPVRLMASTWSLPDRGWCRRWDCFWFCFTPLGGPGLPYFQSSYPWVLWERSRIPPSPPPFPPWLILSPLSTPRHHVPSMMIVPYSCCPRAPFEVSRALLLLSTTVYVSHWPPHQVHSAPFDAPPPPLSSCLRRHGIVWLILQIFVLL